MSPGGSFPPWCILNVCHSPTSSNTYRQQRSVGRNRQTDLQRGTDRQISSTVLSASLSALNPPSASVRRKGAPVEEVATGSLVFLLPLHARVERTNPGSLLGVRPPVAGGVRAPRELGRRNSQETDRWPDHRQKSPSVKTRAECCAGTQIHFFSC